MDSDKPLVYISGGFDSWVAALMYEGGFRGTRDLTMADVLVFTGGEDINPAIYGEDPIPGICFNETRDHQECRDFRAAKDFGIPMVGICRGAQLLNCLSGGKLWQDVDNHGRAHAIRDLRTGEKMVVTSTHHQMMRPSEDAVLVAIACGGNSDKTASLCTQRKAEGITQYPSLVDADPEVLWYPNTKALCMQAHPEYPGANATKIYFWKLFEEFVNPIIQSNAQESAVHGAA